MSAPIVVGVDASRASCDAVFWALSEARRRGRPLLLLHAADAADAEVANDSDVEATVRAAAVAVLQAHRRHARRLAPEVETHVAVPHGDAVHALVDSSTRADLLVVGNRGRAGLAESALGSVSQRVVAHAHCPVVVVPQGSSRLLIRRVALALLGPDADPAELDFAVAEAERWAATLALLPEQGADTAWAAAQVHERHPSVLVELGAPVEDIVAATVAETKRADLVVLRCLHTEAEFGCRIGAVPAAVLARSGCPVALVGHVGHAD